MLVFLNLLQGFDLPESLIGDPILQLAKSHLFQSNSLTCLEVKGAEWKPKAGTVVDFSSFVKYIKSWQQQPLVARGIPLTSMFLALKTMPWAPSPIRPRMLYWSMVLPINGNRNLALSPHMIMKYNWKAKWTAHLSPFMSPSSKLSLGLYYIFRLIWIWISHEIAASYS